MINSSVQISSTDAPARGKSQWQVVWEQLKKHQLAIFGGILLTALYIGAIFAPIIAPYGYDEYSTSQITKYHPPTKVYFFDPVTGNLDRPFIYETKQGLDPVTFLSTYNEDRSKKYYVQFFVSRTDRPYNLLGFIPMNLRLFYVESPAKIFIAGADFFGRDIFSRIWYGAQISLTIGIFSVILAYSLGLIFGGLAGYYGGWIDNLIMRLVEVISAIPELFLLIILTALLPKELDPIFVFFGVVFILGAIGWGGLARIVRSQILSLRDVEYVQAATALGARDSRLIWRHMLPSTATYIIISLSLAIPGFILAESGLSFIGRGIREPYSSWGLMLNDVTEGGFSSFTLRPWVLIPGFFIVVTILCWNFLGDGLRDAFDPRKRQ
jgi:peptide/nickel transport system permease protein